MKLKERIREILRRDRGEMFLRRLPLTLDSNGLRPLRTLADYMPFRKGAGMA